MRHLSGWETIEVVGTLYVLVGLSAIAPVVLVSILLSLPSIACV